MVIYISILLLFFVLYYVSKSSDIKNADAILGGIMMFFLTLVAGLRSGVGMDYKAYMNMFSEINSLSGTTSSVEPGFILLNKLIYLSGGSYQLFFMITAAISYVFFYKFIQYFSIHIFFSLLVFICIGQLYLNSFNAVRQFLAMSIFAYSTRFIVEKKLWKYLICIIGATLFGHVSAILLAAIYFMNRKMNLPFKVVFLGLVLFASKFLIILIENSRYAIYLKIESFTKETSIVTYLYVLLSLFILIREKYILNDYKYKNIIVNMNFYYLIFCMLMITFSNTPIIELVNRYSYYFISFYIILIPALICEIRNQSNKFIIQSFSTVVLIFLFVRSSILLGYQYNLLPFEFNFALFR